MVQIDFLCIHAKTRHLNLSRYLIYELVKNLNCDGYESGFFMSRIKRLETAHETKNYVIPINYDKLKKIGFLSEDLEDIPDTNILHVMTHQYLKDVVDNLNSSFRDAGLAPNFTIEYGHQMLLPKKNIIYSFVKPDATDFICGYHHYLHCRGGEVVSVIQLGFYYVNTMCLTELVIHFISRLKHYGIDQLTFNSFWKNDDINLVKFETTDVSYLNVYNCPDVAPSNVCVLFA
jgi:hypothetical protein